MNAVFRRQLADYVEYHRDPRNCTMHVFGIVFLFLGAVLPLTLWPVTLFGLQTNLATLLAIPVLVYWIALDVILGLAIVGAAIVMLLAAAAIASHASVVAVWAISAILLAGGLAAQIIGHAVFERRRPAHADHPAQFLLGPMFVMAKLFIALGYRNDLAVIIDQGSEWNSGGWPLQRHQGDARKDP
jgi:uncharacterized membrane protein YGL010W